MAPLRQIKESMPVTTAVESKKKSYTNWDVFTKNNLRVSKLLCDGYLPVHRYNQGCHSALIPSPEAIASHTGRHGGGLYVWLRVGDKPTDLWNKIGEEGLEIHDLRCDVCDKVLLPLSFAHIKQHLEPHGGKVRRTMPGGCFQFTLKKSAPESVEEDES